MHKVPRTNGRIPLTRNSGKKFREFHGIGRKQEDKERRDIKKLLKQVRKDRKDEDEAKHLLNEMQINLEEAQATSGATELHVCGWFDEYIRTWDEDRGRPNFIMDKMWQMLQNKGKDTNTLNLTEDFEELLDLEQQAGWVVSTKPREYWTKEKE